VRVTKLIAMYANEGLPDVPLELLIESECLVLHPWASFDEFVIPSNPSEVVLCDVPSRAHLVPNALMAAPSTAILASGTGVCLHPKCDPILVSESALLLFDVCATHVFESATERSAHTSNLSVYNVAYDAELLFAPEAIDEVCDVEDTKSRMLYLLLEVRPRLAALRLH
tara:strand:+ start:1352 stop:1858 length:507 start_codon:yes stop_codon:yes gene_type:complete